MSDSDTIKAINAKLIAAGITLDIAMLAYRRLYIESALDTTRGYSKRCPTRTNKNEAARILGIHRNTMGRNYSKKQPTSVMLPNYHRYQVNQLKQG